MDPSNRNYSDTPKFVNPPENKTATETTGAAITTISSQMDPFPHFLLAGLCGVGSYAAYSMKNPNSAFIAGAIAMAYAYSGLQIQKGNVKMGYDLGTATSLALLMATGPHAMRTKEPYSVAMGSLAGISSIGNLLKSYQVRTGHPRDMQLRLNNNNINKK